MADKQECVVCRELLKKKHKYDIVWKVIAVVSTIIAIIFICLFALRGHLVEETEINTNVEIVNEGEEISNSSIGNFMGAINSNNTHIEDENYEHLMIGIGVVVATVILGLGGAYACYFISQSRRKHEHSDYQQTKEESKSEN